MFPGSGAFHVFHPMLFQKAVDTFKLLTSLGRFSGTVSLFHNNTSSLLTEFYVDFEMQLWSMIKKLIYFRYQCQFCIINQCYEKNSLFLLTL